MLLPFSDVFFPIQVTSYKPSPGTEVHMSTHTGLVHNLEFTAHQDCPSFPLTKQGDRTVKSKVLSSWKKTNKQNTKILELSFKLFPLCHWEPFLATHAVFHVLVSAKI